MLPIQRRENIQSCLRYRKGTSLLEVLIALTILMVSVLGLITVFRSSGTKGVNFSSEHFTAMFLSQKIVEDINFRCKENPYFFDQLIASVSGNITDVVGGKGIFFNLLGNTKNFTNLDLKEDKGLEDSSTSIYKQLKKFKYQVSSGWVPNPDTGGSYPNLINVTINIFWKEQNGKQNSYKISQRIHGTAQNTFLVISDSVTEPFSEDEAGEALWEKVFPGETPNTPFFTTYMAKNGGGDRKIVEACGHLAYMALAEKQLSIEYDAKHSEIETNINDLLKGNPIDYQSLADAQEELAKAFEQEASMLLLRYSKLLSSIDLLESSSLNVTSMGSKLYDGRASLSGVTWEIYQANNQIIMYINGAQRNYAQLLAEPFSKGFDVRKETSIIRNLIALEKLEILFRSPLENVSSQIMSLKKQLQGFVKAYSGKQPIFINYLNKELQICKSKSSLTAFYGVNKGLTNLIKRIALSRKQLFNIEDKF